MVTMQAWTIFGLLCGFLRLSKVASDKGEWWEVNIAQGPVRGQKDPTEDLYVFYNIPYATAPTGEHKYKGPLPPPSWSQPYDAIDKGIICPQFIVSEIMPGKFKPQENCLIANVYVPNTTKRNLSTLVYIHGGAFQIGYGNWRKPKNLMKPKDLIVVTFNYRLGIHGFLCLGTEDVPGNAGMKDQVALLRWIQRNIASFDGNPNDVTIAGYSAGSVSADLLIISKSGEGLFNKVILESGTNLVVFAMQGDPLQNPKAHAKTLNFTDNGDIHALENFYKDLSYDVLSTDVFLERPDSTFVFSPCVERDIDDAFLTESPLAILKRGHYRKVPSLYGFASMEGLFRMKQFDVLWKDRMNNKLSDFLPADLKFETEYEREAFTQQVKTFYFKGKPISDDNVLRYVDYFSDILFVYGTLKSVKMHIEAGHKEIYLYEYSFVDDDTPVVPHTNIRGAEHCAQTFAVLDGKNMTYYFEDDLSQEFRSFKKIIRKLWHNFVKTGKPVPAGSSLPDWPPVGTNRTSHMSLGQKLELRSVIREEMFKFWDNIYEKNYWEPIPSPKRYISVN